ncbi:ATP-binding cassette domain-containing protein [Mycetocola sp. JXN-3]|uniref:ATP-binding cassette domain-containing protein n=1 Tax=Mycetocola sp. JXN-3 TaxID=2116510 RepID=UPI00165CF4D2|nr:ATP-binding cassette domain-containing protein [Mycetocola sp. JXN-3]
MSTLAVSDTLIARDLGHRFDAENWLFRGVNLDLSPGRVYALTGPSGSGKSTFLSILAGWRTPTEGTFIAPAAERVNWVFQNPHGTSRRTALDHVALSFLARGLTPERADAQAQDHLARFGLQHRAQTQFRHLSGGEGQRLMLARGLAAMPALLLVDEPTAQLDPVSAASVNAVLAELAHADVTVVVATHDPDTRDACDEHIDLGKRAQDGGGR